MGHSLLDSLDNTDLLFFNDGHQTDFNTFYNSSSVVDLSLIHSSMIWNTTWEVGLDSWGSDHFPIFIHIQANISPRSFNKFRTRLYWKNIDWEIFCKKVDEFLLACKQDLLLIDDINVRYSSFIALIGDAISNNLPKTRIPPKKQRNLKNPGPRMSSGMRNVKDWFDAERQFFSNLNISPHGTTLLPIRRRWLWLESV